MLDQARIELLILLWLPLAAGVIVGALGPRRANLVRWIAAGVTTFTLVVSFVSAGRLMLIQNRQPALTQVPAGTMPTFYPELVPGAKESNIHATSWDIVRLGPGAIQFYIGLDGLNVWLIVLTAVLGLPSVLVSWTHITERVNEFFAWLLVLQTAMLGIFLSFDIVLFYVFFELSLVPLFFLIGIWGGPERRHAAGKFFIYTLTGSLITLLGVLGVVLAAHIENPNELTFSIPRLVEIVHTRLAIPDPAVRAYWHHIQSLVFFALMAGFMVKVPLFPFHTWLPLAHVEAPTAGSVDLAGVLLKVGAYGFLRLAVPLAPDTSLAFGLPLVSTLAVVGIVYGALCAYTQDDIKKLVAYSSVSHLGLVMLGIFALNEAGISGSVLQMVNHGLSTGGLFLLVGMIYERYHTRKIAEFGGMGRRLPLFGCFLVFMCMTSIGLPGLNGFIGEVLAIMGVFQQQWERNQFPIYGVVGAIGMFLGAWYLMTMLQRVIFGNVKEPPEPLGKHHEPIVDLNAREIITLAPVMALCVFIGIHPQPILSTMAPDVKIIQDISDRARRRTATVAGQPANDMAEAGDRREAP